MKPSLPKKVGLKELADVQFGLYAQPTKDGSIAYLQVKHFNEFNQPAQIDSFVNHAKANEQHLLHDGDILLVGKGFRIFAWCYRETFGKTIASSVFFIIRPKKNLIVPEYLATVLNLPQSLIYFKQLGAGSSIPSIRKSELAEFKIDLIPIERQMQIVALETLRAKELELQYAIINRKNELYRNIISNLIEK